MNNCSERLYNGIVKENPTFVLMLGMCPTLAVTTSAINGLGMGLSTTVVLLFSNMIISALRKIIPDRVRIPAYIVIVASLVTMVQLLLQAYVPSLYSALGIYIPLIVVNCIILGRAESYASKNGPVVSTFDGIGMGLATMVILTASNLMISLLRKIIPDGVRMPAYIVVVASFVTIVEFLMEGFIPALYSALGIYIPLIVVNCIILGRAEAYASKNKPIPSLFDGIGMGLGFTLSITCIGAVRELIGAGSIFGKQILPLADAAAGKMGYEPVTIFILAPGAFFVLAFLSALQNKFKIGAAKRGIDPSNPDCKGGCASCGNSMCSGKRG